MTQQLSNYFIHTLFNLTIILLTFYIMSIFVGKQLSPEDSARYPYKSFYLNEATGPFLAAQQRANRLGYYLKPSPQLRRKVLVFEANTNKLIADIGFSVQPDYNIDQNEGMRAYYRQRYARQLLNNYLPIKLCNEILW